MYPYTVVGRCKTSGRLMCEYVNAPSAKAAKCSFQRNFGSNVITSTLTGRVARSQAYLRAGI